MTNLFGYFKIIIVAFILTIKLIVIPVMKWNNMVVHSNWTVCKDGFFRLWLNSKLILNHSGPSMSKGNKVHVKFVVYRSFVSLYKKRNNTDKVSRQVIYLDEIRTGKSCNKIKLEELDYNCKNLLVKKRLIYS